MYKLKYVWNSTVRQRWGSDIPIGITVSATVIEQVERHKQCTQVLERKECQTIHTRVIICRRNSNIMPKEITEGPQQDLRIGKKVQQPLFLFFFHQEENFRTISNLLNFLLSKTQSKKYSLITLSFNLPSDGSLSPF